MRKQLTLAAAIAGTLLAGCATTPKGGTNPTGTEGQTLGGYVATGATDPDTEEVAKPGSEDETPTGAVEDKKPPADPPPPSR